MSDLKKRHAELRDLAQRRLGRKNSIEADLALQSAEIEKLEANGKVLDQAIKVLQAASEVRRQELKDRVDSLVTRGLRAVFDDENYEFSFNVTLARGQFGVVPVLKTMFEGKPQETSICEGHGGGVADVIGFILRVIVLSLSRPRVAPIMVLDEAFSHVDPTRLPGVAMLLKELSESAGVQFVLITHKQELLDAADVIYKASQDERGHTHMVLAHDLQDEIYHRAPQRGDLGRERGTMFDHEDLGKHEEGEVVEVNQEKDLGRFFKKRLKK